MADYWQLQDGSGEWILQDSSGNWQLQSDAGAFIPDGDDVSYDASINFQSGVVSRRVAATALAVAVSIFSGINSQPEELPRSPIINGGDSVSFVAVGSDPLPTVFAFGDDIVPQPPPPALDETDYSPPRIVSVTYGSPIIADDDIVPQPVVAVLDEDVWPLPLIIERLLPIPHISFAAHDELPRLPIIGANESVEFRALGDEPPPVVFSADDDIVPQAAPTVALDDGFWWIPQALVDRPYRLAQYDSDEIAQAAAPFVPDEDYWFNPVTAIEEITLIDWPLFGASGSGPAGTPAFIPDEPYWFTTKPQPGTLVTRVWDNNDDLPPQMGGEPLLAWGPQFASQSTEFIVWHQPDELPTPPTPNTYEDDSWRVFVPDPIAPRPLYLPDGEQVIAVQVQYEDDSWRVYVPPVPPISITYLPDPESIPGGLVTPPMFFEDDSWRVYVPPLLSPKPAYLPDPEQIPAGLVIPSIFYEDDSWKPYPYKPPLPLPLYLPDRDAIPAGSLVAPPAPGPTEPPYASFGPAVDFSYTYVPATPRRNQKLGWPTTYRESRIVPVKIIKKRYL